MREGEVGKASPAAGDDRNDGGSDVDCMSGSGGDGGGGAGGCHPPGSVDPGAKELSLSAAEFGQTFGMDKPSFAKLPAWKQKNLKVKHGLF
jgi:hypothetical protein